MPLLLRLLLLLRSMIYSLNFHSWRHIGQRRLACCEFSHFMMQWMWKQCEHWPHTWNTQRRRCHEEKKQQQQRARKPTPRISTIITTKQRVHNKKSENGAKESGNRGGVRQRLRSRRNTARCEVPRGWGQNNPRADRYRARAARCCYIASLSLLPSRCIAYIAQMREHARPESRYVE